MKIRIVLLCAVMALFPVTLQAGEQTDPPEFSITSKNQKFIARVTVPAALDRRGARPRQAILTVAENNGQAAVLWSCPFRHRGYANGILSDDGTVFVYVNPEYSEKQPIVTTYYRGSRTGEIPGKAFAVPAKKIRRDSGLRLWLPPGDEYYHFISVNNVSLAVVLTTIDGKSRIIQTQNGKIVQERKKR